MTPTHLDCRYKFLRLSLNFWEIGQIVADTGIVAKVDLECHSEDIDGEDDGRMRIIIVVVEGEV